MDQQNKKPFGVGVASVAGSLGLLLALSLSGCNQYFERQDPISLGVGNAIAQNKVTHTIDPWPPGSQNPRHATNGARALIATRRYEKNVSIEPEAAPTQKVNSSAN